MKGVHFVEKQLPKAEAELRVLTGTYAGALTIPTIVYPGAIIQGFDQLGSLELKGLLDGFQLLTPGQIRKTFI